MMSVRFGVFDHMDRGAVSLTRQYEERLKLIEAYDRGGFHAYHLAEHHATPLGMAPSPSVFLAAVAQRTKRLRFGALVHTLSLYHPLRLAEEICMLDQMSGGRLELGIGRGISPHELAYYGVQPELAQSLYVEASDVILKALSGPSLTYRGEHFRYDEVPIEMRPVQAPHPPLWCGTSNPEGAGWFAENRVNVVTNVPTARARAITDRYREEWARLGGKAADIPLMGMARHVVIAETQAEAMALGRPAYATWYESFMLLWNKHGTRPPNVALPRDFEDFVGAGLAFVGTPQMVREQMQDGIARAGINYLLCRFAFGDLPYEASRHSVELFVSEVMGELAA
ncbi:Flavin-dependent oxidoreductase, luciferase family (includes alkanesulfonate monooxygenase SsuD and methylene tetrahydromethanopterin reductase) [Rhizobiales bacterium GAS113]|nr:Flavin-dependent oxidoreductase, luciferase family (includes alkanesulfonate monooxygenase SsuD and methylene tetrahydromethanopterin reductase) [Rhizobiales bacterium GAS113]